MYVFIMYVNMIHEMLFECIFVLENKSLTNVGESLNPRLLLKSWCVFKLCLEYFRRGFLFCCFRRAPLGNVENSMESVDSYLGKKSSGVSVVHCSTGESKLN